MFLCLLSGVCVVLFELACTFGRINYLISPPSPPSCLPLSESVILTEIRLFKIVKKKKRESSTVMPESSTNSRLDLHCVFQLRDEEKTHFVAHGTTQRERDRMTEQSEKLAGLNNSKLIKIAERSA